MSKTLIIVESPGKINKIQNIVGDKYKVIASVGHIIDLDKKNLSIDTKTFECKYVTMEGKNKVIENIKKEAAACKNKVLIATDKDREGEMIAWSIAYVLNLPLSQKNRITFTSITKDEIIKAINSPTTIDMNMVDSQQVRRLMDRLVGYEISPLLSGKLSAGRVQSVVTRLIIDRENEINKFVPTNYFKFKGSFNKKINAKLCNNKKTTKFPEEKDAYEWLKNSCIDAIFTIGSITSMESVRNPPSPYTTSILQQDANKKLRFNATRTMSSAQRLYEEGYITYMRTDSMSITPSALDELSEYIINRFGTNYYKRRSYESKGNTQEAHEAIRPTDVNIVNVEIGGKITSDEVKLYNLIWKRTVASQMESAIILISTINILINKNNNYYFESKTELIKFDGYLKLYQEVIENKLGDYKVGQVLSVDNITGKQTYDKPISRYNEASLIDKLDPKNLNIGRPSTYASIINKIKDRKYVEVKDIEGTKKTINILELINNKINKKQENIMYGQEKNKFIPTVLGINTNKYLIDNFPNIMDYKFTSNIEDKLDTIANGELKKYDTLKEFYEPFHKSVVDANKKSESNIRVLHECDNVKICALTAKYGPVVRKTVGGKHIYAPIKEPLNINTITMEDAMTLFEYPKLLGKYKRKNVTINKGKYGLYVEYGNKEPLKFPIKEELSLEEIIKEIENNMPIKILKDTKYSYSIYSNRNIKVKPIKNKKLKSFSVIVPQLVNLDELTIEQIKNIINAKFSK